MTALQSSRPSEPVASGPAPDGTGQRGGRGTGESTARHVSLTSRARVFIAVGIVSILAGLLLGVRDLERVGVLFVLLPVPAWAMVRRTRASIRTRHELSSDRISVGESAHVRLTLRNPSAFATGPLKITEVLPGDRRVRFSVSGVRARQQRVVGYPLPTLARGRYLIGPATVVADDPFGLVTAHTESPDVAELVVQPRRERLAQLPLPVAWRDGSTALSHSVGTGGSDDASVREYRRGDDLRKIHWRSTAKLGSPMVRQEERPWHGESLVLLDTRHYAYKDRLADGSSGCFEWAISAAASIGCHLIEAGRSVNTVLGDGRYSGADERQLLDLLADTHTSFADDVEPLVRALGGIGRESSVFAVLSGFDLVALSQLARRPRNPGSAVAVLIQPWTWRPGGSHESEEAQTFLEIATRLRAAGWRVVPAAAGDLMAGLWPALLGQRMAATP